MVFYERLLEAQRQLQKTQEALYLTLSLENKGQYEAAFEQAFQFAEASEKLTLLARALPAHTGHPKAKEMIETLVEQSIPVTMGFAPEGWFALRFPALLPRKERGNVDYIRAFLYPAVRRFAQNNPPIQFGNCVLVFRHIYDRERPERLFRDHDNIEVNVVVDILAAYLLRDDAPMQCAHYYCSAAGDADGTEVFIVPRADFGRFMAAVNPGEIEAEKGDPKAS
ncbi:MAG: DUF6100 family protein [Oscillospiraceae bacterium]|jgi:hypothetical protein|nr:DUF6100 family protein [Oscillospiraceae bacterium]